MSKRLDEAIEEVIDAVVSALKAEITLHESEDEEAAAPLLEANLTIVRGDRSRPRPATPAIWVFPEAASIEHNPRTLAETWRLPIALVSIWKDDDPEEGYKMASSLAARARSVVIRDRSLGKRSYVQDTRSGRFEASAPWHSEGSLFAALALIEVIMLIRE